MQGSFCGACGQARRPLDPSLREMIQELGYELADLDGRVWSSLRRLFLAPGYLTKQHFIGRRASWLPPIRMYLIVSVAYFAISALTGEAGLQVNVSVTGDSEEDRIAQLEQLGFSSDEELQLAVQETETRWLPRIMFVLMPIFAGLVYLAYRRSGRRYPSYLVFSLHVHTAWFGLFAVTGITTYVAKSIVSADLIGIVTLVVAVAYLALALRYVFDESLWRAIAKGILLCGVYAVITIAITVVTVGSIVFTGN